MVDSLSLLNFVIVDEARDRIWFLDESEGDFDVLTTRDLEKEKKGLEQADMLKVILAASNR
jgi:hypothetical protein